LLATAGSECDTKLTPLKFSKLPCRSHKEGTPVVTHRPEEFATNRVAVAKTCVTNCPASLLISSHCSTAGERRFVRRQIDNDLLEMALLGYKTKREEVMVKMAEIEGMLRGQARGVSASSANTATPSASKPKRKLSAAGRRAIRAGVKKRWAAFHAKSSAPKTVTKAKGKAKRVLSPSAKAKLTANLALARAARAQKRAAQQTA